jgi:hypothetical protein
MELLDVARGIRNWAVANRMMDGLPSSPVIDDNLIRSVFGNVGVPNALNILQGRGVTHIGVDRSNNSIVVFTEKRLRANERNLLSSAALNLSPDKSYSMAFVQCSQTHTGGTPPPPSVPPYYEHNGKYSCGSSVFIGSEKGAGTLGCLVRKDSIIYGLSNNHVVGGSNYAPVGLPIVIPGLADVTAGGRDPETVGHMFNAYPFVDGIPDIVNCDDNLDAAIFIVQDANRLTSMQRNCHDTPDSVLPISDGMEVEKVGRSTGLTRGKVLAEIVDFAPIQYDIPHFGGRKHVWFKSMFAIKSDAGSFSKAGDSGSLITHVDSQGVRHAVGILVGGNNEGISLVLSIDRILTHFGVTLVSGLNV